MPGRPEPARHSLQVDPFRQGQRIIQINAEIAHSAVHFRVAKQQLDCAQVAGLLVNLGNLCAPHRMRAIGARFQPDREHPVAHDPGILARGKVWASMETAWPEILTANHFGIVDPSLQRLARRVGDLEAHGFARLALRDRSAFFNAARRVHVVHLQANQIAASEFAVDGHVEQREIALVVGHFQPDADGPDMLGKKWPLLADDAAFVQGARVGRRAGKVSKDMASLLIRRTRHVLGPADGKA